ncbi:MAG: hypothetical protein WBK95_10240 [Sulfurimonas sp.]
MLTYNANELFSATEVAKNFATITPKLYQKEVQKALFEEDRKFVAAHVEKIKSNNVFKS